MKTVPALLIDRTNYAAMAEPIRQRIAAVNLIGLDTETADPRKHQGLVEMSTGKRLVFDINRTDLCGLSIYPDDGDAGFYFNIGHKDVENRLLWEEVEYLLSARRDDAYWVIHNAPFEIVMLGQTVGYQVTRYICTLQMAVSAYGPDEYPQDAFWAAQLGDIGKLMPAVATAFAVMDDDGALTPEQSDLLSKVIAKESDASHSYNGWVREISYGYGLKSAVKTIFGYDMTTFEQVVGKRAGMHELTGAEVVAYGADDAIWCLRLYHWLHDYMLATNPKVLGAFFEQELPMVQVYADVWRGGLRIRPDAVRARRGEERAKYAQVLRDLKAAVRTLLPFPDEPHQPLLEKDGDWYRKNHAKYRGAIADWAASPDSEDDLTQARQIRGAVTNAWLEELGLPESKGPNLGHYMPVRVLIYDLLRRERCIVEHGKVQSDGESRGKMLGRYEKDGMADSEQAKVLRLLNDIASIEQRMKLYLTPYLKLVDPDTGRLYPVMSSKLASRRMATQYPNPMQLQKRGDSTYVRGFYEPDGPFTEPSRIAA